MIHIVEYLKAIGERDMAAEVLNAHNRLECFCTGLDRDLIEARKRQIPEGMSLVSTEPVAWGVLEWENGEPNPECHAWSFIAGWNELAQEHIKDLIQAQIDSGDRPMKYKAYPLSIHPQPTHKETKDAKRYQWLRAQHWNEADMAVVCHPKKSVRLGFDCPCDQRLDDAIDSAMIEAAAKEPK